jgi:hypothetical protein
MTNLRFAFQASAHTRWLLVVNTDDDWMFQREVIRAADQAGLRSEGAIIDP